MQPAVVSAFGEDNVFRESPTPTYGSRHADAYEAQRSLATEPLDQETASYCTSQADTVYDISRSRQGLGATHLLGEYTPEPWKKIGERKLSFRTANSALAYSSIDGGGIRGYWSLLALQRLMHHVADYEKDRHQISSFYPSICPLNTSKIPLTREEQEDMKRQTNYDGQTRCLPDGRKFLPCHYFDYIFGSSTGSLISIMLGRLRMTVSDCIKQYETLGDEIFGKPRRFTQISTGFLTTRSKYNTQKVEELFKRVCKDRCGRLERRSIQPDNGSFRLGPGICKTYVITYGYVNRASRLPFPIRSYPLPPRDSIVSADADEDFSNSNMYDKFEIWQVARAAIAAPLFFDPFSFKSDMGNDRILNWQLEDGGYGDYNNPTELGIQELESIHRPGNIQTIVSIGTSRALTELGTSTNLIAKARRHAAWGADPELVHSRVHARQTDGNYEYHRFNDPGALDLQLDDWQPRNHRIGQRAEKPGSQTLQKIKEKFEPWSHKYDKQLKQCARKMVETRIARAHGQHNACQCILKREGKVCTAIKKGIGKCESLKPDQADESEDVRQMRESMWERFALRSEYRCGHHGCIIDGRQMYQHRHDLKRHLNQDHHVSYESMTEELDRLRVGWLYPND